MRCVVIMFERLLRRFRRRDKLSELPKDSDCPHWDDGRCLIDKTVCIGYENCVSLTVYTIGKM
jgi:hypothetical protein